MLWHEHQRCYIDKVTLDWPDWHAACTLTPRLAPQGEQTVNGYGVLDLYDYDVSAECHAAHT